MAPTSDPLRFTAASRIPKVLASIADGARPTDVLGQYSACADDGRSGAEKREASALLSVAGGHLDSDGDVDEALRAGRQALDIFRRIGDTAAVADSLRVVVDALKSKALRSHKPPEEAAKEATDALASFKADGDARGQSSMLLSLARVGLARHGVKAREAALRHAKQAATLAAQSGDSALEAQCISCLAEVQLRRRRPQEAVRECERCLAQFKAIGDLRGQAQAMHTLASARGASESDQALKDLQQALIVYRDLGDARQQVVELLSMARLHLERSSPSQAKASALEALAMVKEAQPGGSLHSDAVSTVIRAYEAEKDTDGALQFAKQAAEGFQAAGHDAAEVDLSELLSVLLLKSGDAIAAVRCAKEAAFKARDSADIWREAAATYNLAKLEFDAGRYDEALRAVRDVLPIYRELENPAGEARSHHIAVDVYAKREEWEDALRAAADARKLFGMAGEKHDEGRGLLVISVLHWVQEQEAEAMSNAREAQFLFQRENDNVWEATSLHHISEMFAWSWNCSPALKAIARALALVEGQEDRKVLASLNSTKAVIRLMQVVEKTHEKDQQEPMLEMADEVMAELERAKGMSEEVGEKKLTMFNMFHMAEVQIIKGSTGDAMTFIKKAEEMNTQLADSQGTVVAFVLQGYAYLQEAQFAKAVTFADSAEEAAAANEEDKRSREYANFLAKDLRDAIARQLAGGKEEKVVAPGEEMVEVVEVKIEPEQVMEQLLAVAMNLMGNESLIADTPLMDAGLDSLSMVEFRNELVKEFPGVNLPGALLFDYPTLKELQNFIMEGLTGGAAD